jgi:hypothetical protein
MPLTTNLRRKRLASRAVASAAITAGALILRFTPTSGYDDGWFDPKWWVEVGAVGLLAWGAFHLLRRRPAELEDE